MASFFLPDFKYELVQSLLSFICIGEIKLNYRDHDLFIDLMETLSIDCCHLTRDDDDESCYQEKEMKRELNEIIDLDDLIENSCEEESFNLQYFSDSDPDECLSNQNSDQRIIPKEENNGISELF